MTYGVIGTYQRTRIVLNFSSTGAAIVAESAMEAGRPWDGERGRALVRVPTLHLTHAQTNTQNDSEIWYRGLECALECLCR